MKRLYFALILLVVGCNKTPEENNPDALTKVTLQLNWLPEAEHGGYYEALLKGYYKEEGLDVTIQPGGPGVRVETETALGRVDFGIANADKILTVRDKGLKLMALMSPFESSPRCLMVHESSSISNLSELKNAELLILNNTKPFYAWLTHNDPELKTRDTIPYNKAVFMTNKTAAMQGYVNSEPLILKKRGVPVKSFMVSDTGFNPYTSVLICAESMKKDKQDLIDKMNRASAKGWKSYLISPQKTNAYIESINPSNKGMLDESTEILKGLMSTDESFGRMKLSRWETLGEQLLKLGVIKTEPESFDFVQSSK